MSASHDVALATAVICLALAMLATIAFLPGLFLLNLCVACAGFAYLLAEEDPA